MISPGALTVIVGPNNCGKSRILKDLVALITKRVS
jgi:ABC-type cobalamin/Fe3+-siderophores transport system ATPase subunit